MKFITAKTGEIRSKEKANLDANSSRNWERQKRKKQAQNEWPKVFLPWSMAINIWDINLAMIFPILSTLKLAMLLNHGGMVAKINGQKIATKSNEIYAINGRRTSIIRQECGHENVRNSSSQTTQCQIRINFQNFALDRAYVELIMAKKQRPPETELSITVEHWDGRSSDSSDLLNMLRPYNIVSLELHLSVSIHRIEMPNLGLFMPNLRQLLIISDRDSGKNRSALIGSTFLRDLPNLRILRASNVDFSMGEDKEAPQWIASLERLHLQNCSVGAQLPRWMPQCMRLERILLQNCGLRSLAELAQLEAAVQIRATGNHFGDVHRAVFQCTRLRELDLHGNGISRIGRHTFSRCQLLRFLDLSDNHLMADGLSENLFQNCRRLMELRLENIGITHLRPELFLGLRALKSLSLSGNALSAIDPFTFLPTRSIRQLHLNKCTLTQVPLAVTQCCLLDSLALDDNRFVTRASMSAPILALLPRLSRFSFARSPLLQLPWALFLYEPDHSQHTLLEGIVDTLIQLPVWRLEPCTPYLWHIHLRNASSTRLRQRMAKWDDKRMHREHLAHCGQLYETIMDGIQIYRELRENNGCEATRRLRNVRAENTGSRNGFRDTNACTKKETSQNGVIKNVLVANNETTPISHSAFIPSILHTNGANPNFSLFLLKITILLYTIYFCIWLVR